MDELTILHEDNHIIVVMKPQGLPSCGDESGDDNMLEQVRRYIKEKYGYDCFADDSGLEITALGGAPGVFSARFSGEAHNSEKNMDKMLSLMQGASDRSARFRTVAALVIGNREYTFEGEIKGQILEERRGKGGFGYDPIFLPEGETLTFAEMSETQKNAISHRARAMKKLADFLLANS